MAYTKTLDEFITQARLVHGNKYDYSKVDYVNNHTKVCIICPIHGEFWQNPCKHLIGHGCHECIGLLDYTKDEIMLKITSKCSEQGFKFISLCDKNGFNKELTTISKTYIKYQCNKCGNISFSSTIQRFLKLKNIPCCKCNNSKKFTQEESISKVLNKCKELNLTFLGFCDKDGNKIKEYIGVDKTYLILQCNVCGYIWKKSNFDKFLHRIKGCPNCLHNRSLTEEEAQEVVSKICSKLDLSFLSFCDKNGEKCNYKNTSTKLHLKCNKCNKEWKTTTFLSFTNVGVQCPSCRNWSLEKEIEEFLRLNNLTFYHDRETNSHLKWLKKQRLDFFLPKYNIGIECQRIQHFKPFSFAKNNLKEDKKLNLQKQQERDERKRKLCEENGIKLLYYSNLGIDYPYQVYENKEELLKEILKENDK